MRKEYTGGSGVILLSNGGDNTCQGATDTMLVGTVDGIYLLERQEPGWQVRHRALQGVFVSAITALPGGALIAATHGSGLARSDDGGRSWRWVNRGLTQFDFWSARAGQLGGREVVLAGTLPAHLFKSEDGGETWSELEALRGIPGRDRWYFPPPPNQGHVKEIVMQGGRLFVGIEVGALLVSDDGGASFTDLRIDPDPHEADIHRIALHPARPGRIVVANGLKGMMATEDGGANWHRISAGSGLDYPEPMVMHPDEPDLVFVAGATGWPPHWYKLGRARGQIARSRDGGGSWERMLGGLPDGQRAMWGALTLHAWPGDYALYAADTDGQIFESSDEGDHWQVVAEVGAVSKGDFHRALAKNRPRIANIDDLTFFDAAKDRMAKIKV